MFLQKGNWKGSTCMCCRSQSKPVSPASFFLVDWDATRRALPMQEAAVSAPGEEQPDRSVPSGGWVVKPHLPGAGWELPGDTATRAGRVSVLEAELPDCGGQPAQHSAAPRDGALADMLRQVLTWGSDDGQSSCRVRPRGWKEKELSWVTEMKSGWWLWHTLTKNLPKWPSVKASQRKMSALQFCE